MQNSFFRKFFVLRQRSSDIALFVEHPVYSIFKVENVLSFLDFVTKTPKFHTKKTFINSENSKCSTKEPVILLVLWNTLHVAFSKFEAS